MLDSQRLRREDGPDPGGLPLEQLRPSRIVVDEQDAAAQWLCFFDMRGANLFIGQRAVALGQRGLRRQITPG